MARAVGVLATLFALICSVRAVTAQITSAASGDDPARVTADSVVFDSRRDLYEARGSVVIRQGERRILADWLIFNGTSGQGIASGGVRVEEGDDVLRARFLEFNVNTRQGVVFDGHLDSEGSGFEMRGEEIVKTGDDTYTFREGAFTTCDCGEQEAPEPWQIAAGEAEVELGGYVTARNASVDILGVPVVWLPWAMLPIKTERQTGFLLPDLGLSAANGFELGLPFFWAAADPLNVTITPRWLSDRGFKGDLDLEYIMGSRSRGSLFGSLLDDAQIDPHSPATPFGTTRWSLMGLQDFFLPGKVRLKANFAFVSDNQYVHHFDELRTRRSFRFLQSSAFASRTLLASERVGVIGALRYADDLQNPDDRDRDDFILQHQSVELTALPAPLEVAPWIVPAFDVEYAYFRQRSRDFPAPLTRADGVFVDTGIDGISNASGGSENDGLFDEGELLADRGHRLDLWPRLGFPVRLANRIELYPEVGWRETLYRSNELDFEERGMFTALLDLRTRLERRFGERHLHVLEPRLGYALVTAPGQSANPLFVPDPRVPQQRIRHLELLNVVADGADRVESWNSLLIGFGNKFYRRGGGGAAELLADISISGQVNFETGRRRADWGVTRERFAPIYLEGSLHPASGVEAEFSLGVDPEDANVSEGLAELSLSHSFGLSVSIQYRYLRDIPAFFEDFAGQNERFENFVDVATVSQASGFARMVLTKQWSANYWLVYSFDLAEVIGQGGAIDYFSRCRCWGLGLAISDDRSRGPQFNVFFQLVGLGKAHGATSNALADLGLVDGF